MESHTIILSTTRILIPEIVTNDFVTNLINRGLTGIEYFGIEIDNPEDYIAEDMKLVSAEISYFDFNFDTQESFDYDSFNQEEVYKLISELFENSTNIEIRASEKDITIYL